MYVLREKEPVVPRRAADEPRESRARVILRKLATAVLAGVARDVLVDIFRALFGG